MTNHKLDETIYYQKGENPELLFLSGTHGDEYQVITSLRSIINQYETNLPDFIYIPEVSPSAVAQHTRTNGNALDLNRIFKNNIYDKEAKSLVNIIKPFHFQTCFSFHEDPEQKAFYMYDNVRFSADKLSKLRDTLLKSHISLYSGIDDPSDPLLGCPIEDGYYAVSSDYKFSDGFFMDYMITNKKCNRFITLEIPGKSTPEENLYITTQVFHALRAALDF